MSPIAISDNLAFDQMIYSYRQRRRIRRPWVATAAALVAAVPVAIVLVLGARGGASALATGIPSTPLFLPYPEPLSVTPQNPMPLVGEDAVVATLRRATQMRVAPAGRVLSGVGTETGFGSPQTMWVVDVSRSWAGVVSPIAGNNKVGWIPTRELALNRINWQLDVSLSARRLTVLHGGHAIRRFTVAIGRPGAPTPTGRFAVTDRILTGDPGGPYGCCILALSAEAPHAIQGWDGGNRIAIHSTPETSSIGEAVSHGCMRLTLAEGRWLLHHIPLGTPTLISS
ncbi:MAG: L,D-transpeptidase [Solirubrobacteraceae bacterium]